jgi:anti-sigma factor RsiW
MEDEMNLPPLPRPAFTLDSGPLPSYTDDQLRDYATAAVKAEREQCARLADEYATWGGSNFVAWFQKLAAAIRARGE